MSRRLTILAVFLLSVVIFCVFYCVIDMASWFKCAETNQESKVIKQIPRKYTNEMAAYDNMLNYILNPRTPCKHSVLLGGVRLENHLLDGDKLLCLDPGPGLKEGCLVYSFGINEEWSFEETIRDRYGCQVYAFDPSTNKTDHMHSKDIWFYDLGIGGTNGQIRPYSFDAWIIEHQRKMWNIQTFKSILERNGHNSRTIDVLKMDIEGTEFKVFENMLEDGVLKQVNHLCVEIHLTYNSKWQRVLDILQKIETETGLRHFSTRNNTQASLYSVPGFPARKEQFCFELSWYRP